MRTRITLACTECKQRNYDTTKDKKTHPDRMETKKYCRFCKAHTLHKETKQLERRLSMGDSVKTDAKTKKPSFFKGLKKEFKKITWPDKSAVTKQTIAVITASIALGLLIAFLDFVIQNGIDWIVTL